MADLNTKRHSILIVDDDKFLLDMYSIKFSERGFEVVVALDGEEALEKLDGGLQPDIFLIDILMPKVDGFALITKLKERKLEQKAAIIILSNLGQQDDIDKGLSLGVDGYIIKASATPTEVVDRTAEIADNKLKVHD
ncbi:MAG: response regulator [Patescibacteria group bacterium]|nr:response regulator [Patescibacteria group bacterium]